MRGAPAGEPAAGRGAWIIPADAGSTYPSVGVVESRTDHPRRCGEHNSSLRMLEYMPGSSPQMRGALCSLLCPIPDPGIIPADAGSTIRPVRYHRASRDHPRRCGEHSLLLNALGFPKGSSPQMRGAPLPGDYEQCVDRIIPADAGSTGLLCFADHLQWDHPRRCGEHSESEAGM